MIQTFVIKHTHNQDLYQQCHMQLQESSYGRIKYSADGSNGANDTHM